jgi:hypothetical protein
MSDGVERTIYDTVRDLDFDPRDQTIGPEMARMEAEGLLARRIAYWGAMPRQVYCLVTPSRT